METILFDGEQYRAVARLDQAEPLVVVTMEHWALKPKKDGAGYAQAYLEKHGYNYICIRPVTND